MIWEELEKGGLKTVSGKARNVSKGSKSELDPFQEVKIVQKGSSVYNGKERG